MNNIDLIDSSGLHFVEIKCRIKGIGVCKNILSYLFELLGVIL